MMLKNACFYRIADFPSLELERHINMALNGKRFTPCMPHDKSSIGFCHPITQDVDASMVVAQEQCYAFSLRVEEKVLPAPAINQLVKDKIKDLKKENPDQKILKKEREIIKEGVVSVILPNALKVSSYINGYIDVHMGVVVVDAPTETKADLFIDKLWSALSGYEAVAPENYDDLDIDQLGKIFAGTRKPRRIIPQDDPSVIMTDWIRSGNIPAAIIVGDECSLKDDEDGSSARIAGQKVQSSEVMEHIEGGKHFTQMAVSWNDCVSTTLKNDFTFRRISMGGDVEGESPEEMFDAEFAIFYLQMRELLPSMLAMFGGEQEQQSIADAELV